MQFLLWDAQRRAGISDEQINQAMVEKLAVNKQRKWPEPKDGEPRLHIKEQPAPVVPEVMADPDESQYGGTYDEDYQAECAYVEGWNACRAAMLQAGNSPVTPDGYVLVPKEITCAMDDAAWEAYHETRCMSDIWAALLAVAPKQEDVK
mgnify:CR=1 FL=1